MKNKFTNMKSGKHKKRILLLCLSVLLILLSLFFAGKFLMYSQSPQKADAVIVLSGGAGRVEKAIELYNEGYASNLILSNVNGYAGPIGDMLETALAQGIPENDIITENLATSTYENAELTLPILNKHMYTSAIIVSSDFHMRRVKFNFDRLYRSSGIQLTYVASETNFTASRWWSNHFSRGLVFEEYSKMIGNFLGYNGPEAKKVLNKIKSLF
ncbi:YdcF family protein [Paenibacillus sp. MMS20-IR301]|uniref:YdcF family protein n=1 Tax=Paenibacillus sp. MMS20-IR301 TaxID=2895946 RepID=UPI0028EC88FE|nr:YdcF family protein [Paenibacillus sp. MMS20-IR301]WNS43536.1 YdcF family protein [Paenibacillus sp. MMS20-IR301]